MPDQHNTTDSDNRVLGGQGFPADNPDGTPGLIGPDEYTKQINRERLERGSTTVVGGNYADLQRIGEQVAGGPGTKSISGLTDVVGAPPGVDVKDENVVTGPQLSAQRGEWDRESERAGLVEEPTPPPSVPVGGPNPVDPGNESPQAQETNIPKSESESKPPAARTQGK